MLMKFKQKKKIKTMWDKELTKTYTLYVNFKETL